MAPRIAALPDSDAPEAARPTLQAVAKALGTTPNLHRTLANSPATLNAYAQQSTTLASGRLAPRVREAIALATASSNGCQYCASAHSLLGRKAGLSDDEVSESLARTSSDSKLGPVLDLVTALLDDPTRAGGAPLAAVREAGYSEEEVVEIVAHVGMNVFTNMFNNFADTEVDFPLVELAPAR